MPETPDLPSRQPAASLGPRDGLRIAAVWAIWGAAILALAAAAWSVRFETLDPWREISTDPPLARWDATWYREIATRGYSFEPGRAANSVGYYPLYPLVVGGISRALGVSFFAAGIGFSLLCLLAALLLFGEYLCQWAGREAALPGIACLLFFPTSFYFASAYTESLFLLTTVAAILSARRGRWAVAGFAGFAAALLRLNGAVVVLPLAWYAFEDAGRRLRRLRPAPLASVAATVAGASLFPAYLWYRWGDPLLYIHVKTAGWSQQVKPVWTLAARIWKELLSAIGNPRDQKSPVFLLALASLILFLFLTVVLFRRKAIAEGLYAAGMLLVLLHSGVIQGAHRYVLVLFPCFAILSQYLVRRPVTAFAYAFAGAAGEACLLAAFVHWIYVA